MGKIKKGSFLKDMIIFFIIGVLGSIVFRAGFNFSDQVILLGLFFLLVILIFEKILKQQNE